MAHLDHLAVHARARVSRSFSTMEGIARTASGRILEREPREPFWPGRSSRVG